MRQLTLCLLRFLLPPSPDSTHHPADSLPPKEKDLQEVVVVAYAVQKRSELTSAVSLLQAEKISNQQVTTLGQALQGTTPGVQVINVIGQPGENPTIRVRGIASITADASPLIVLDGTPFDGNLNMINPADIGSVSVLKDASASALYGSRAANGVILISTRQGREGNSPSIALSATCGVSSRAVHDYPYLNTARQFQLGWEAMKNTYAGLPNAEQLATENLIRDGFHYNPYGDLAEPVGINGQLTPGASLLWNDNWTRALENNHPVRADINLHISSGNEHSKYYCSLGYLSQDSYIIQSNYRRISTALNYTTDYNGWLQTGAFANIVSSTQNYPDQGSGDFEDLVQYGRTLSSVFPIYARDDHGQLLKDAAGDPQFDFGQPDPTRTVNVNRPLLEPSNLVGTTSLDSWTYTRWLINASVFGQINFSKNLYYRNSFGVNRSQLDEQHVQNKDYGDAAAEGGRIYQESDQTLSWTWNNMLVYRQQLGQHHFEAMLSYEAYRYGYETMYGSKTGFAFSGQGQLSNAGSLEELEGYTISSTLLSYLGRATYNFREKYFVEFTLRRDGSSIFAPGNRFGTFPALGLSWLLSREKGLAVFKKLTLLKWRASYGALGNNALLDTRGNRDYFPYQNSWSSGYNDLTNPGVYLTQLANNSIQWERQWSLDIGIDFGWFRNRLTGSIDFFQKDSRNLLLDQPLPPSAGFSSIPANIGNLRNKGVELSLSGNIVHTSRFSCIVSMNLTWLQNKILHLLPGEDTFAAAGAFRNTTGKSLYEFYMPLWAGVDPNTGGGQWWVDQQGAGGLPTGQRIRTDSYATALTDQKWVGSGIPSVTGGFSAQLRYQALDLDILFNYALGGKYYDANYAGLMNGAYAGYGAQLDKDELKRWQYTGEVTNVPKLNPENNDEGQLSTRFLFSGDYIRLRNITVGYTCKRPPLKKAFRRIRLYAQADNILTLDRLKQGSDPESAVTGFANGNASPFKTFSTGIDLTL